MQTLVSKNDVENEIFTLPGNEMWVFWMKKKTEFETHKGIPKMSKVLKWSVF